MSSYDKSEVMILIGVVVGILGFVGLMFGVLARSDSGDKENTKRTLARYELCKSIEDPASKTICANSNITIRR